MLPYILVVEDNTDLHEYIHTLLTDHKFTVKILSTGAAVMRTLEKTQPDLVLLDLTLPDMSGEGLCQEIHKKFPDIRIIILTAKDAVSDKVHLLSLGADDYITKPFAGPELIARIRARLRNGGESDGKLTVGDLEMDIKKVTVKRADKPIKLTAQEFKLLEYLMHNAGQVLSRDMILNRIWMYSPDMDSRVVDVYIGYLRKKIDAGRKKKLIQSVRGFGYTLKE